MSRPSEPGPGRRAQIHALVVGVALVPLVGLIIGAATDSLGANPIEEITHETGEWALRFLMASLAITPLRLLFGWRWLAPYRRTFGLLAFGHASLHFATWIGLDLFFDWEIVLEDLVERPYITAGFTALMCMLPLAITSTRGWVRRLGRRWLLLHRLAYVAGIAAVVHFLWLVKADLLEPGIYAAILATLFGVRLWDRSRRRAAQAPRRGPAPQESEAAPEPEPHVVPIEDAIDLHTFKPRDVAKVVEAYLEAAVEAGHHEVRLIHGKGKGVQRERVQGILASSRFVERYEDAPPTRGGWGATLAWLKPGDA